MAHGRQAGLVLAAAAPQPGQPGRDGPGGFQFYAQLRDLGAQLRDQPARLFQLLELIPGAANAGQVDALVLRQPLHLAQRPMSRTE